MEQTCGLFLGVGDICFVFSLVLLREEDSIGYWFSFKFVELHFLLRLIGKVRVNLQFGSIKGIVHFLAKANTGFFSFS